MKTTASPSIVRESQSKVSHVKWKMVLFVSSFNWLWSSSSDDQFNFPRKLKKSMKVKELKYNWVNKTIMNSFYNMSDSIYCILDYRY